MDQTEPPQRFNFVTQATVDNLVTCRKDSLGHDAQAEQLVLHITEMHPGSVIAVQGSWGRGKTDLLLRVAIKMRDRIRDSNALLGDRTVPGIRDTPIWLNPWQYGSADLLTPLVLELTKRAAEKDGAVDVVRLKAAAKSLSLAGLNIAGKISTVAGDPVSGAALQGSSNLLEKIWPSKDDKKDPELLDWEVDPVASMGSTFKRLVDEVVPADERSAKGRLLICIDDLDRCLPDRQVAFLEAIGFLAASGAPATFLIALDKTLATEALHARYMVDSFSADLYLDKLFDLRINLPAVDNVQQFVKHRLEDVYAVDTTTMSFAELLKNKLAIEEDEFVGAARDVFKYPELRNPRALQKVFEKLRLLALNFSTTTPGNLGKSGNRSLFLLMWLLLTHHFPPLRQVAQLQGIAPDEIYKKMKAVYQVGSGSVQKARDELRHVKWPQPKPRDSVVVTALVQLERSLSKLANNSKNQRRLARILIDLDSWISDAGL
jgi:hypothetical protein